VPAPNLELWRLRRNAGLSTNDLGALANTTGKTIRACERGHIPHEEIQKNIAAVFRMTAVELFNAKAPVAQ
jgi:DNA-binding XRE family transcriptional regulator